MNSEELSSLIDSKKVNENGVGTNWKIVAETPFKGDAWIRKSSQLLLTQKKSTKIELVPTGKSSPKHLSEVTHGFGSARSHVH